MLGLVVRGDGVKRHIRGGGLQVRSLGVIVCKDVLFRGAGVQEMLLEVMVFRDMLFKLLVYKGNVVRVNGVQGHVLEDFVQGSVVQG